MVSLPPKDLAAIREEIVAALESEGGWTKGSLLKFKKLDSALREIGRFHGLMQCIQFLPLSCAMSNPFLH